MSDPHSHPSLGVLAGPAAAPPSPPPPPDAPEDTKAQALSEALGSSFAILKVVMIGLVGAFLCSGIVVVGQQEKAIKLRFGRAVGDGEKAMLGPGLHWAFPAPIDEVVKIPVSQVQSVDSTIGWYATTAAMEAAGAEPPPGDSLRPGVDGYLLTADGNIIHVRCSLRYRISEPGMRYTFDFAGASNSVQNALNNALVYAAAHYRVDDALTRDVAGFHELIRTHLEKLIEEQNLGITVDQIDNLRVIPPRKLKENFEAVLATEVRAGKELNEARSYANQTISRAKSDSAGRINAGENDRKRLVELISAEARRFTDLLPAYRRDSVLFRSRQQSETMQRVLTNSTEKLVLPAHSGRDPVELRLLMSREVPKPKPLETPKNDEH